MATSFRTFLKSGHAPTLFASLLYFTYCCGVWVTNGAMAPFIKESLQLSPAQVGVMLSVPIFAGAIITEQVFKVNGIGAALIGAIHANDLPMVQTLTFIFAVLIVLFNLIADILYGVLDPRIRYD